MQRRRQARIVPQELPAQLGTPAPVVVIVEKDNPIFTGKRREERFKKICPCCNEKFTTKFKDKIYKGNHANRNKKRRQRAK